MHYNILLTLHIIALCLFHLYYLAHATGFFVDLSTYKTIVVYDSNTYLTDADADANADAAAGVDDSSLWCGSEEVVWQKRTVRYRRLCGFHFSQKKTAERR